MNQQQGLPGTRLKKSMGQGEDKLRALYPNIDWTVQLRYGEEIGLGWRDYELVSVDSWGCEGLAHAVPPFDFPGGECYTLPTGEVDAERKWHRPGSGSWRCAFRWKKDAVFAGVLHGHCSRPWSVMRIDINNVRL